MKEMGASLSFWELPARLGLQNSTTGNLADIHAHPKTGMQSRLFELAGCGPWTVHH